MLITKEVNITIHPKNIYHFENLGYEIPRYYNKNSCTWRVKRGTKITVNINDVLKNSTIKILVSCDLCGKENTITYQSYNKHNRDGEYFCNKCSLSLFNSGENNPSWNPNLTDEERAIKRSYDGYKDFTRKVLLRDNYTCKCCGKYGGKLIVHHLDGYNWNIDGRTDEKNSVTLCENCHYSFHAIYGNGNNTKEQFEEWLGKVLNILDDFNGIIPRGKPIICYESSEIYECPTDFEDKTGILAQRVIDCCNKKDYVTKSGRRHRTITVNGNHYFWLDEFNQMTESDFDTYFEWCKPIKPNNSGKNNYLSKQVICLNTLKVFDCVSDAVKEYDKTAVTNITRCCEGIRQHSGQLPDGTKLKWMYYKDYLKLNNNELGNCENSVAFIM